MRNQLLIFYLFFGLLILALLNLFIILSIRVKGETVFYRPDPKSPNYKKLQERYRKRASSKALIIAILALLLGAGLTLLQLRGILDEGAPDALGGLLFGPAIMIFAFFFAMRSMSTALRQGSVKRTEKRSNKNNDGSWLV